MEVDSGDLPLERLREFVATIREAVAAEEFDPWVEVAAGLGGWPGWAQDPDES